MCVCVIVNSVHKGDSIIIIIIIIIIIVFCGDGGGGGGCCFCVSVTSNIDKGLCLEGCGKESSSDLCVFWASDRGRNMSDEHGRSPSMFKGTMTVLARKDSENERNKSVRGGWTCKIPVVT